MKAQKTAFFITCFIYIGCHPAAEAFFARAPLLAMFSTVPTERQVEIIYGDHGKPVIERTAPVPTRPRRNHVLVKVHAIGLNPVDAKQVIGDKLPYSWTFLRRLFHNCMVRHTRCGFDFSGTVCASEYPDFPVGARVFGTMPPLKGSAAPIIQAPLHQLAVAPGAWTLEEAAAMPLVGLTAIQSLQPIVKENQQSRVLVIGGSGGTGHVILQVAKALGATTVATLCSPRNFDFCKDCGASHTIDYRESDWLSKLKELAPFDVVSDCVTSADPEDNKNQYPQTLQASPGLLTEDYAYRRLGGKSPDWIRAGLARPNIFPSWLLWPKGAHEQLFWIKFPRSSSKLQELAAWADQGKLKPSVEKVYHGLTAENVQKGFDDILGRRVRGKIVVTVETISSSLEQKKES